MSSLHYLKIGSFNPPRFPFPLEQIMRVEGRGNYSLFVRANGCQVLMSRPLRVYEELLPISFVRVHKSYIVNTHFMSTWSDHRCTLLLTDGYEITVSRRRKSFMRQYFKDIEFRGEFG